MNCRFVSRQEVVRDAGGPRCDDDDDDDDDDDVGLRDPVSTEI